MGAAGPGRPHKCGPVHHRLGLGPRAQAGQGGGRHGYASPGFGSGSGQGFNPGSSWPTPVEEGPRPGHVPKGRPTTAEPHPGPH